VNAILAAIRSIPRGRVAAYGQVALLAGLPRGARQVSRVLHSLSDKEFLPWHRVLNRNGCISLPLEGHGRTQAALLRKEGVAVDERGRVDLNRYGWKAGRGSR
jgi:methylated-DNA-protein-cysteine methyltransferase-like protein